MNSLAPLVAFWPFSFAVSAVMAAALAPIVIHLWNRQQFQRTTWAATELLLAALRKNVDRLHVEQWLLLALRVAILALAAVALADPSFSCRQAPGFASGAGAAGRTHTVLVIDGSYSMNYAPGPQTRFDQARQIAIQRVESAARGDGFTLLVMGDSPRVVVGEPAFNAADVVDELSSLRQPHGGAALAPALAETRRLLEKGTQLHPRLDHRHVVLLTDLGRATWSACDSPEVQATLAALGREATLELIDVGQEATDNLAVTSLELLDAYVTVARGAVVRAEVQNFDVRPRAGVAIDFFVDGRQVQRETLELPPGGRATAQLTYRFDEPGDHVLEARLQADRLEVDNHRWLVAPVWESLRVLCVGGGPRATYFLARILQPTSQRPPRVEVTEIPERDLQATPLGQYDAVFLSNLGRFTEAEARLLGDYVRGGGGLAVYLGDEVQPEGYNEWLGAKQGPRRVLPAELGELQLGDSFPVRPLGYAHPIVAPFRGHENSGLLTTPVWRYYRLHPHALAKVALGVGDDDALIVTERIGRGHVALFATAATTAAVDRSTTPPTPWTLWPTWSSFGPVTHETLAFLVRGRTAGRNVLVGQELRSTLPYGGGNASLRVLRPDGGGERLQLAIEGDQAEWSFAGTDPSGVYTAEFDLPGAPQQRFAVNVATTESDLARYDPDLLPAALRSSAVVSDAAATEPSAARRGDMFRWLLGGVLGLALLEMFFAWHLGSRRR